MPYPSRALTAADGRLTQNYIAPPRAQPRRTPNEPRFPIGWPILAGQSGREIGVFLTSSHHNCSAAKVSAPASGFDSVLAM